MREIKFRAWDITNKKMILEPYLHFVNGHSFFLQQDKVRSDLEFTLMQYVGLKDKNEKDIFEGDIFTTKKTAYKIFCLGGAYGYAPIHTHTKELADAIKQAGHIPFFPFITYPLKQSKLEIIGNIYENAELLKNNL